MTIVIFLGIVFVMSLVALAVVWGIGTIMLRRLQKGYDKERQEEEARAYAQLEEVYQYLNGGK